jgi:hypothetical protein
MSFYKQLLRSSEDDAYRIFAEQQKRYENKIKLIPTLSFGGGIIAALVISNFFGDAVSAVCVFIGTVWYILGYQYCSAMWRKEKDAIEFSRALSKYKKL